MDDEYPKYVVKLSSLPCQVGKEFVWNAWTMARKGGLWRNLGSYRSEADGHAAVEADRARGHHI